jgi:hypothetical protein
VHLLSLVFISAFTCFFHPKTMCDDFQCQCDVDLCCCCFDPDFTCALCNTPSNNFFCCCGPQTVLHHLLGWSTASIRPPISPSLIVAQDVCSNFLDCTLEQFDNIFLIYLILLIALDPNCDRTAAKKAQEEEGMLVATQGTQQPSRTPGMTIS